MLECWSVCVHLVAGAARILKLRSSIMKYTTNHDTSLEKNELRSNAQSLIFREMPNCTNRQVITLKISRILRGLQNWVSDDVTGIYLCVPHVLKINSAHPGIKQCTGYCISIALYLFPLTISINTHNIQNHIAAQLGRTR